jgi:hypothetical protein
MKGKRRKPAISDTQLMDGPRTAKAAKILAFLALSVLSLTGPMLARAQASQGPPPDPNPSGPEIVVNGALEDIVVNGRARHCYPLRKEPLDSFDASPFGKRSQSVVLPVGNGKFALLPDEEQVTGPTYWQRVGTGIDQYIFRAPSNGSPLCIGAKGAGPEGFAQLRRITDAAAFRGKRVRFTAWAATNRASLVRFWLAAGTRSKLTNGGNTDNQHWGGSHGWTPILLEFGPVSKAAAHISYGFLLYGDGDVWLYNPKLEVVTDERAGSRTGDIAIIGRSDGR